MPRAKVVTENRLELFFKGVAMAMPVSLACKYAGISKSSWYSWLEDERKNGEASEHYGLQERFDKADGERAYNLLSEVYERIRLDKKNWQLLVWLLGRIYPEYFSNPDLKPQVSVVLDDNSVQQRIREAIDKAKAANVAEAPKGNKTRKAK